MRRKFDITHKGFRYWATRGLLPRGRPALFFWSSHPWPFYHGHYIPSRLPPPVLSEAEREECWQHFVEWLPFQYEGELA
jgi:hypothetical protein